MPSIRDAIHDLFNRPELTTADAVDRHFDPAFRQRVNGAWIDRQAFTDGIAELRSRVVHVRVDVLDEFVDGTRYAERHVIEVATRDGELIRQEVFLFGAAARDGRFLRLEEVTFRILPTRTPGDRRS